MHFAARHTTRYRYSSPVWCQPLTVRLKPRTDFRQRPLLFSLDIEPAPKVISNAIDFEGNEVTTASFDTPTDALPVTTTFEAETDDVNPFQFLLRPDAARLPLTPLAEEASYFALYGQSGNVWPEVQELAHELGRLVDFDTLKFVWELN